LSRRKLFASIEENPRFQGGSGDRMSGDNELIDRLLSEYRSPEEIVGLLKQLTKAIVERALQAELTTYLHHDPSSQGGHLDEISRAEVGSSLISNVTDAVIEQVRAWQCRSLDTLYPVMYFDVLNVKMREQGRAESRAVHMAAGITLGGKIEVLGLWIAAREGAELWLQALTDLQNRGVKDIFIACVDDLKGFPQAIEAVYPKISVQLCIVHMVRASLNYVSWKERRPVSRDLKLIYRAVSLEEAEQQLNDFAQQWDGRYPSISALWRRNWLDVVRFFQFPPEIRKIIYTTNAIESLNLRLRKTLRTRGAFLSEEDVVKVVYLASRSLARKWTALHGWKYALNCFSILWEARFPQNGL
jgi:putative transposase